MQKSWTHHCPQCITSKVCHKVVQACRHPSMHDNKQCNPTSWPWKDRLAGTTAQRLLSPPKESRLSLRSLSLPGRCCSLAGRITALHMYHCIDACWTVMMSARGCYNLLHCTVLAIHQVACGGLIVAHRNHQRALPGDTLKTPDTKQ